MPMKSTATYGTDDLMLRKISVEGTYNEFALTHIQKPNRFINSNYSNFYGMIRYKVRLKSDWRKECSSWTLLVY